MTQRGQVLAYAAASGVGLVIVIALRAFTSAGAPSIVHVRWAGAVDTPLRLTLERQFGLRDAEQRDATTWTYELTNPAPSNVAALVAHPGVADTHYIDRARGVVAPDAPRRVRSGSMASTWGWTAVFLGISLAVSGAWLLTMHGDASPGAK